MGRIAILAALMSAAASLMPVSAATAPRNYEALILVGRRASAINVDLLQATQAYDQTGTNIDSASAGCLGALTDASGEIDADLGELSDLASLSSLMKLPADRRAVDRVMRIRIMHRPTEIATPGRRKSPPLADRNRHLRPIEFATLGRRKSPPPIRL